MSIAQFKGAIKALHGCTGTHVESVPVKEEFQGKVVWDGIVEVFHLEGHPKTDKAYAWWYDTGDPGKPLLVTVLHTHSALTPSAAVRAFIAREFHKHELRNAATGSGA
jgi:hypothetical protein